MNTITTGDEIKVLAVTLLDDQNTHEFFACQDGSSLYKIRLKNANFNQIPYRTMFFAQGKINNPPETEDYLTVDIDLELKDHRFVSFEPNTVVKSHIGLSVHDHLESLPVLSDSKPVPDRIEFGTLDILLLKKHSHYLRLIRDELACGDFGNITPKYIKGSAYQKLFDDYKERARKLDEKFGVIDVSVIKTKVKHVESRKRVAQPLKQKINKVNINFSSIFM